MDIRDIFKNPDIFPHNISHKDSETNITFIKMSHSLFRETAFLRALNKPEEIFQLEMGQLLGQFNSQDFPRKSPHFIFHVCYCGSTFATRLLDAVEDFIVLREPLCLDKWHELRVFNFTDESAQKKWQQYLPMIIYLLGKTYHPNQNAIVKASNGNSCMAQILSIDPNSRGIFLYNDLISFITNIMSDESRRIWANKKAEHVYFANTLIEFASSLSIKELSTPKRSALLWLTQMHNYIEKSLLLDSAKIRSLQTDQLMRDPVQTLEAMTSFFGKKMGTKEISPLINENILSKHSKTGEIFTTEIQLKRKKEERRKYASEINEGLIWAEEILKKFPLPDKMPFPLF